MLPTIVTSRPSRIQTVPSPITTIQWNRDQGSRSSRAGTLVSIVSSMAILRFPESALVNRRFGYGAGDGLRPVPRAARGAAGGDAHLRPSLRLAGRGVPGDRLVPAAPRRRGRPGSAFDHGR